MQITTTGRHVEITDALRQHIETKISKMDRLLEGITEVHVVLSVEKHRHTAEITLLQANGNSLRSIEETHDMYESVDTAIDKIEKQARKHNKRKDTSRKARAANKESERVEVEPETDVTPPAAAPKVIRTNRFAVKPMSVEEAGMQIGLVTDDFLVFLNSETNQINVMFKRKDGNYGLIEPEF
jgi:putative sigma-54 modulation protein